MTGETPNSEHNAEAIIERMRLVRSAGHDHADELHGEAKRLFDWTEYVRAKPLVSIAVASLLGFSIVRSAMRTVSKPNLPDSMARSLPIATKSMRSTLTTGFINLAISIANSAVKNYFATLSQRNNSGGVYNDRFRQFNSKDRDFP